MGRILTLLGKITAYCIAYLLVSLIMALVFDFINPCGFTMLNIFRCSP